MKYFVLVNDKRRPCKQCNKIHKFITHKDKTIVATDETIFLLNRFFLGKFPIIQVDSNALELPLISIVDYIKDH